MSHLHGEVFRDDLRATIAKNKNYRLFILKAGKPPVLSPSTLLNQGMKLIPEVLLCRERSSPSRDEMIKKARNR